MVLLHKRTVIQVNQAVHFGLTSNFFERFQFALLPQKIELCSHVSMNVYIL